MNAILQLDMLQIKTTFDCIFKTVRCCLLWPKDNVTVVPLIPAGVILEMQNSSLPMPAILTPASFHTGHLPTYGMKVIIISAKWMAWAGIRVLKSCTHTDRQKWPAGMRGTPVFINCSCIALYYIDNWLNWSKDLHSLKHCLCVCLYVRPSDFMQSQMCKNPECWSKLRQTPGLYFERLFVERLYVERLYVENRFSDSMSKIDFWTHTFYTHFSHTHFLHTLSTHTFHTHFSHTLFTLTFYTHFSNTLFTHHASESAL